MKIKYNKSTLLKIEQLFTDLDYTIRYEKGQFQSGYCIIHQKKIVVINKFFDIKGRIENLLDILNDITYGVDPLPESFQDFSEILQKRSESETEAI